MTVLIETSALENMTVSEGNLHIVELLQAAELIPADVADSLRAIASEDYFQDELYAVLDPLPLILEGPNFAVATTWDDLPADD